MPIKLPKDLDWTAFNTAMALGEKVQENINSYVTAGKTEFFAGIEQAEAVQAKAMMQRRRKLILQPILC